jgi:hypothetical protein
VAAEHRPLIERLRILARNVDRLADPDFVFGAWEPSRTDERGVMTLPWYEFGPGGNALLDDVRAGGWITPFDWPAWAGSPDGKRLIGHPDAVATASADDLGKLLTTYVRGDRFNEGLLASAHEDGMLAAIARRAARLADDMARGADE